MIGYSSLAMPPSEPPTDQTAAFFNLLNLVGDPEAAKKRLSELFDATVQANKVVAAANSAQEQLVADRAEHDAQLKAERDEHGRNLADAKAQFEADSARAWDE